jgi:hypothetical protein
MWANFEYIFFIPQFTIMNAIAPIYTSNPSVIGKCAMVFAPPSAIGKPRN